MDKHIDTPFFFFLKADNEHKEIAMPEGYNWRIWRPKLTSWMPKDTGFFTFGVWFLFHIFHIFSNRDYAVIEVSYDNELVHRSCIFPRCFRSPFMRKNDLELGDTWTHPGHRGRGLAAAAMVTIMKVFDAPSRRYWGIIAPSNIGATKVVERAGFKKIGTGRKFTRFKSAFLGYYAIVKCTGDGAKEGCGIREMGT